ncbi:MAG: hypothetical protein ACREJM_00875, partial [Candidatus Saccharimonadales bacterium]
MANLPVPLPKDYLAGLDLQKYDFEHGTGCYLHGEWREHGFWYYYVYASLVKVPLGTVLLGILALAARPRGGRRFQLNDVCLLSPALSVFALVSWQSGAVQYFRYVLPSLPFGFIFAARAFAAFDARRYGLGAVAAAAVLSSAISSLRVFPHFTSYFNELAGGPSCGYRHLGGDEIDAGHDAWYLKEWVDRHPEAAPLRVALPGQVSPRDYGIKCDDLFRRSGKDTLGEIRLTFGDGSPLPGWYAISLSRLHQQGGVFRYFSSSSPEASVGYTTYIYHVADQLMAKRRSTDVSGAGNVALLGTPLDALIGRISPRAAASAAAQDEDLNN